MAIHRLQPEGLPQILIAGIAHPDKMWYDRVNETPASDKRTVARQNININIEQGPLGSSHDVEMRVVKRLKAVRGHGK